MPENNDRPLRRQQIDDVERGCTALGDLFISREIFNEQEIYFKFAVIQASSIAALQLIRPISGGDTLESWLPTLRQGANLIREEVRSLSNLLYSSKIDSVLRAKLLNSAHAAYLRVFNALGITPTESSKAAPIPEKVQAHIPSAEVFGKLRPAPSLDLSPLNLAALEASVKCNEDVVCNDTVEGETARLSCFGSVFFSKLLFAKQK